ncbi:MAG TPA: hypothetical protein VNM67_06790 [Thermoanaerobaculia bacterium]|jgi:hypothetical protein|nr:hypothetical protein [Thermoanaerobaculia bacterium]
MATVQELSALHRRYADVSHRFRAGWTFHQFLQSINKSLLQRMEDPYSTDFQDLYAGLKEISQSLHASESDRIRNRLEGIERRLADLMEALDAEDNRVTPDLLRQFFRRVRSYDEKILTQLVKFYLYVQRGDGWDPNRLDKVDFLLARLSEEEDDRGGEPRLSDYRHLSEIFQGLWAQVDVPHPGGEVVRERRTAIDGIRAEAARIEGLEDLNTNGLIRRYREIKHGLGSLYFEPELLLAIQDTNLALKNRIHRLYGQEEQRIVAEYQRVFELEREVSVDRELDQELGEFREAIERFERQLQREEFKLEDIALIRQRVRELLPRLTAGRPEPIEKITGAVRITPPEFLGTAEHILSGSSDVSRMTLGDIGDRGDKGDKEDILGAAFRRLVKALHDTSQELQPEKIVLLPDIFPLRLEPREVVAFRRIFGKREHDVRLEQFLLEAAALRMLVNEEAQEVMGIMDETSITGDSPIYIRARRVARLADDYLWRFSHMMNGITLSGDGAEARAVEVLRMRLMRDYSGLWLLAFKPFFSRRPGMTLM